MKEPAINYEPKPIDLEDVQLPEGLNGLTEQIAEQVHEIWAASRIKEGWKYGPVKNSEKKETPLLVPYDELPESEKDYDRNTAIGTIKMILKLGYSIEQ